MLEGHEKAPQETGRCVVREEQLYVLRLWRDGERAEDWRASLKDIESKEVRNFGSLEALVKFLASGLQPGCLQRKSF